VDWNNDGRKDLITGENNGQIRVFLNTNTDADPVFNGYFLMQQGGTTFDCGSYSSPLVTDWNNDGLFDILCGESGGRVYLLVNTGTPGNPMFSTKVFLKDGAADLKGSSVSTPTVADWNRDGKKDLLLGDYSGNILFYENITSDASPAFNGKMPLKVGPVNLDVGYYSRPFAGDWDNDGVVDILCGDSNGLVYYFQSMGPLFANANVIPENTGASILLDLDAGAANANRNYLILGTVSGTQPGFPLPGGTVTLPLNWDPFTDTVIAHLNSPVFSNFLNKLNAGGKGHAYLNAPPIPGWAGSLMQFTYCLNNPFDFVSNASAIEVVP
jgi:hypothetical protein